MSSNFVIPFVIGSGFLTLFAVFWAFICANYLMVYEMVQYHWLNSTWGNELESTTTDFLQDDNVEDELDDFMAIPFE